MAADAGVGGLLKASRLRVGEELADVARMLCIRKPYLEAIEDGRYEDLPGTTYASGFVRSYAEHLGLDADVVVRRFKTETSGKQGATRLDFPVPVHESGVPSGALLFVGLVIAALAYGAWFVSTSETNPFAGVVSPVPEEVTEAAKADEAKTPELAEKAETPVVETRAVENATETTMEKATTEATDDVEPAVPPVEDAVETVTEATAGAAGEATTEADEEAAASLSDEAAAPEPTVIDQAAETPELAEATGVEAEQVTGQASAEPEAPAASVEMPVVPEEASNEQAAPQPESNGTVYGQENANARIIVMAVDNTYIQVRDEAAGDVLIARLLIKGDSYLVPNQDGLKLLAGNAGGVQILVDGQKTPSIGGKGVVRRGVVLDAERLKGGTAVEE